MWNSQVEVSRAPQPENRHGSTPTCRFGLSNEAIKAVESRGQRLGSRSDKVGVIVLARIRQKAFDNMEGLILEPSHKVLVFAGCDPSYSPVGQRPGGPAGIELLPGGSCMVPGRAPLASLADDLLSMLCVRQLLCNTQGSTPSRAKDLDPGPRPPAGACQHLPSTLLVTCIKPLWPGLLLPL